MIPGERRLSVSKFISFLEYQASPPQAVVSINHFPKIIN